MLIFNGFCDSAFLCIFSILLFSESAALVSKLIFTSFSFSLTSSFFITTFSFLIVSLFTTGSFFTAIIFFLLESFLIDILLLSGMIFLIGNLSFFCSNIRLLSFFFSSVFLIDFCSVIECFGLIIKLLNESLSSMLLFLILICNFFFEFCFDCIILFDKGLSKQLSTLLCSTISCFFFKINPGSFFLIIKSSSFFETDSVLGFASTSGKLSFLLLLSIPNEISFGNKTLCCFLLSSILISFFECVKCEILITLSFVSVGERFSCNLLEISEFVLSGKTAIRLFM